MPELSLSDVLNRMGNDEFIRLEPEQLQRVVLACPDMRLRWEGFIALFALVVRNRRRGHAAVISLEQIIEWLGKPCVAFDGEEETRHYVFEGPQGLNAIVADFQRDALVGFGTMPASEIPRLPPSPS